LGQARWLKLVVRDANDGITCDNADWVMARLVPRAPLRFNPPCFLSPTECQVTLTGPSATACVIEASSDLLTWLPLTTNAPFQGTLAFLHYPAAPMPRSFYRAKLVP
jgi:hypothetical protein